MPGLSTWSSSSALRLSGGDEGDVGGELVESETVVGESCPTTPSCVGSDGAGGSIGASTTMSDSMLASGMVTHTPAPDAMSAASAWLTGRSLLPGVTPGNTE